MSRRATLDELIWLDDPDDIQLAVKWAESVTVQALGWVWQAFDRIHRAYLTKVDLGTPVEQLERGLVQLHVAELNLIWARETQGYSSFQPLHEPYEFAARSTAQARPPQYDFCFISVANRRWAWPIEAKVLPAPGSTAEYIKDVRDKFIAGVDAPFVGEGGMIGYLLDGSAEAALMKIGKELQQELQVFTEFSSRPHRTSLHGRGTAPKLRLHHMIMCCSAS